MQQPQPRGNERIENRALSDNTLGELRAFLAGCEGMTDDARWFVRTGIGRGHRTGSRPTGLSAVDEPGRVRT